MAGSRNREGCTVTRAANEGEYRSGGGSGPGVRPVGPVAAAGIGLHCAEVEPCEDLEQRSNLKDSWLPC